ncbi:MAG: pirin family protein [Cyclobacteriaceae bacterium]
MSNQDLIIEERSRDIGDFLVGRLLPFRKKRMVGPFIFIDHMGPSVIGPRKYMDVDQHPHIGLSTLTYLLEGEMMHEDSMGTKQLITPGSVNWMTAGKAVTHTERTPLELRDGRTIHMHGYQIWVALPKHLEDMEPSFHHIEAKDLPRWGNKKAHFALVAGEAFGRKSPVPVHSDLFMVEVKASEDYVINLEGQVTGEIGICVVEGQIQACEHKIDHGNMLISKTEDACEITLKAGAHVFLFGGKPFDEPRHIYWNFVASEKDTLEKAKQDWRDKNFPKVPGDESYIPLP